MEHRPKLGVLDGPFHFLTDGRMKCRGAQLMSSVDDQTDRMKKLSDGQRVCLRLVNRHHSSKEIARILKISRHTVDQRLALACRILGTESRREAARLFAEYDPIIYEPSHIADRVPPAPFFTDTDHRERNEPDDRSQDLNDWDSPDMLNRHPRMLHSALPFPLKRGEMNDLNTRQRLSWAAAIFVGSILASGILIVALETLGRLL
jgi:DNA-binding CsgD family transcriptional regulator